jgi:hypothetical protein
VTNKAHTAVVRRVAARWGGIVGPAEGPDILLPDGQIEVETSATLALSVERLKAASGRRYVAVTNKETVPEALRLVEGTGIGVLNSHGDVLFDAVVPFRK